MKKKLFVELLKRDFFTELDKFNEFCDYEIIGNVNSNKYNIIDNQANELVFEECLSLEELTNIWIDKVALYFTDEYPLDADSYKAYYNITSCYLYMRDRHNTKKEIPSQ